LLLECRAKRRYVTAKERTALEERRYQSRGVLNKFSVLLAVFVATLVLVAAAGATLVVGVNDDAGSDPALAGWFDPTVEQLGLTEVAFTLRWDETAATAIPNQAAISAAVVRARTAGITVELDLYPLHSTAFTGGVRCLPSPDPQGCGNATAIGEFGAWTARVARAFPRVHQFVVMNECNQPLFVNPQWFADGTNESAEICGRALASSYDAVKAVNAGNFVWGVGLSPRGNDNPNAVSDSSTSPVQFLLDLGAWFRSFAAATGRTTPLMDGLDFHPYPIPQSLPFATGYAGTTSASVSNLPRIYQAFYTGFAGTPQPTIGEQAGGGEPLSLNEAGIQTDSSGRSGYTGTESSATAAGGVVGQYATEAYQASWYQQMLNLLACDPNVRLVNIYHLIDEANLAGWQSGLYYLDRTAKQSAKTVHDWLAQTRGRCQGPTQYWLPPGIPPGAPSPQILAQYRATGAAEATHAMKTTTRNPDRTATR
jgi:hypothetical protein